MVDEDGGDVLAAAASVSGFDSSLAASVAKDVALCSGCSGGGTGAAGDSVSAGSFRRECAADAVGEGDNDVALLWLTKLAVVRSS